jgi:hypothetical protein
MNTIEKLQPEFKTGLRRSLRQVEASSWAKNSVGINVVFGISDLGLPARFLAGFAPAFSLAEAIAEKKAVSPELRVFVPLHLSEHANGITHSSGEQTVRQGVLFIQKFEQIFHPTISWFLDVDKPITQKTIALLSHLSDELLSLNDPTLALTWEKAFNAAQKRGNKESAKIYTPHHIFGWHDAWDSEKFFPAPTKMITINCFSTSEETFQSVRKKLMPIVEQEMPELVVHGDHLDLFTDRCPGPHYMPRQINNKHEPLLSDLLTVGFAKTRQELSSLVDEGFRTAFTDLVSIEKHINALIQTNPMLPNTEEFIQEVKNAAQ